MNTPATFDNRQWNTLSDEELVEKFDAERLRLENDERISLHARARSPKTWLDYGGGAGLFAGSIQYGDLSGEIEMHTYDPSPVMRNATRRWIDSERVHSTVEAVPDNYFEVVWCGLVVCIVEKEEVANILSHIRNKMTDDGMGLVTICNPKLWNVPETRLDRRYPENHRYMQHFDLPKWKLEGGYGVTEKHRPIHWYRQQIQKAGMQLDATVSSPEYSLHGKTIQDYIGFKCSKTS